MIRLTLAALIALTALPALAQDRMTRAGCQDGAQRLFDMIEPGDAELAKVSRQIRVAPNGFCQITRRDLDNPDIAFGALEWRMDGSRRWVEDGIPPQALEVRVLRIDPDRIEGQSNLHRPSYDGEVILRQEPEAGLLVLERLHVHNSAGDEMTVSGVFERVFLSSPSMMQVSMGAASFKAGLVSMTLTGTYENPFGMFPDVDVRGTPQALQQGAFEVISALPEGIIDAASRAELTAFAGDLPKPVGTLDIVVGSERGLGLMQVLVFGWATVSSGGGELDVLLDGMTVDADWSPAAQVAD